MFTFLNTYNNYANEDNNTAKMLKGSSSSSLNTSTKHMNVVYTDRINKLQKLISQSNAAISVWDQLSYNPGISIGYVLKNADKPWNWRELSCNQSITMQDVLDHPDKPWDWSSLSYNTNITMQDVLDHPDKPWNWSSLSYKRNITMQNVLDHPDKPWNWYALSRNQEHHHARRFGPS